MAITTTWQDFIAAQREIEDYPLRPEQLAALELLFSDPTAQAPDIAKHIVQTFPRDDDQGIFWHTIANAIKQLTDFNDRLVDLVAAMQQNLKMSFFGENWSEFIFYCTCVIIGSLVTFANLIQLGIHHLGIRIVLLNVRAGLILTRSRQNFPFSV